MKKYFNLIKIVLLSFTALIVVSGILFNYTLGAVSKDKTPIVFDVEKNDTYLTLSSKLKESGLIKSELIYKIYIRIINPKLLKSGRYTLSKSMSTTDIIKELEKGSNYNSEIVKLTIPEGKNIEQIATIISNVTNNTKDSIINIWDSSAFVNSVIDKYWFIDETVLKAGIRHPLEGYLFPSTYELLNANVTPQYIAFKLLDQMDIVLSKYKNDLELSELNIHEILTLASIVQYESGVNSDMADISQVFYNRLEVGMKLESSVTVCYALGITDNWVACEKNPDLNSPYNTYKISGLPIGPILNLGEDAIKATLFPNANDYLFFLANVCDKNDTKTYFSKTYDQHLIYKNRYLTCY